MAEDPKAQIGRRSKKRGYKVKRKQAEKTPPPPLKRFDYSLVSKKLEGLLFNLDRDLERRITREILHQDDELDRCLTLLHVILRFARNSYEAVLYFAGDTPPDPRRKPKFAFVVPPINRQLLDLLFSLVYMLDDFRSRSMRYQRAAFRELSEERHKVKSEFSGHPEWESHFANLADLLRTFAERFHITDEERMNPSLIPYWKHPFELKDEKTKSRPFLRYLDKWLYADTSAQAHLSFAGLFSIAGLLLADLQEDADRKPKMEERTLQQYHFVHVSRTAIATLAIATEIDCYCKFGNGAAIDYLWTMFSEYADEAKEMWNLRYRDRPR